MQDLLTRIRADLLQQADEAAASSGQRYFKQAVQLYGVKATVTEQISKKYFREAGEAGKKEIFQLCEQLWQSDFLEEGIIACQWSYFLRREYKPSDFRVFEKWVHRYISNWATCDTLCNHTVGAFVEMYPEYLASLKVWAKSPNLWARRAAAVSLIIPARQGKFLHDIFEIADCLLMDQEDLVQKGYGWMLKAASQAHQQKVFDFVMARKKSMPRTALRYAIEKMPPALKKRAMAQ